MSRNMVGFRWWGRSGTGVRAGSRSQRENRHRLCPWLLELEARRLLSTFTVQNSNGDDSNGSLRWAVDHANAAQDAALINFDPGIYRINLESSGVRQGLVLSNPNITIQGPSYRVIVSGSNAVNHVFWIDYGVTARISGLDIWEGFDEGLYGGAGLHNEGKLYLTGCDVLFNNGFEGGALQNNGTATLSNCTIRNNRAYEGGGIRNEGTLNMDSCTIASNAANIYYGDDVKKGGGLYNNGPATITNSVFEDNTSDKYGAAIYNYSSGSVNMMACSVTGNKAGSDGGGFYNWGNGRTLTLTGCSVTNNSAGRGGAVFNASGNLNMSDCTVSGNSASTHGGALYSGGSTSLVNCTVSNNQAMGGDGGGLLAPGGDSGTTVLNSCTFDHNTATEYGGGLYNYFNTATITNCTFSHNSAGANYYGGGIYNHGTATLTACTFSGNTAYEGGGVYSYSGTVNVQDTILAGNNSSYLGPDAYGTFNSLGSNLIGNTNASGPWNGPNDQTNVSPLLAPLENYGGPTPTIAQLPGSLAIGTGAAIPGVTTDQRGVARPIGNIDIGAFQSRGFTIAVSSGNNQSTGVNSAFGKPLVASVSSAYAEPVLGGVVNFTAPLTGASCTFPGGSTTVSINGSGLASIGVAANATVGGPYAVSATTTGAIGAGASFSLTNSPAAPYQLVIHTQPSPTAAAGAAFSIQPVIYVEDRYGNLETGDNTTLVTAGLKTGTGPLRGTTAIKVSGGVATFTNLSDNTAETISLRFTTKSALAPAISSNIVVSPTAPYELSIHTQPSPMATAGVAFGTQPVIYVADKYGNLETGDSTTQVTVGLQSGTGPLGGTTKITVSGGVGKFAKLFDNRAETISLVFTSVPALAPAISNNVVVSPAAPSMLKIHTQPSSTATAGTAFSTQPVIYVEDKYGNLETGDNTTLVTAGLYSGAGPLGGMTTTTISRGVAAFSGLNDTTPETISLLFTSVPVLAAAISNDIVVSPGLADKLVIHTQPSPTATAGAVLSTQPVIYVEDQFGNLETGDNTTLVTAALNTGTGPLGGTTTIKVSGGVASFSDLYDPTAETINLLFTSEPALVSAISSNIVVSPAAPYKLSLHTQPLPTAKAGVPFPTQPVIYVLDQYGNLETGDFTTQVTASLRVGIGPLLGKTTVTVSGGIATFTNLSDNTPERIILLFTSRALVKAQSNPITVNALPASARSVTANASIMGSASAVAKRKTFTIFDPRTAPFSDDT